MRKVRSTRDSRQVACNRMCGILQELRGRPKDDIERVHSSLVFFTVESDMGCSTNDAIVSLAETMLRLIVNA